MPSTATFRTCSTKPRASCVSRKISSGSGNSQRLTNARPRLPPIASISPDLPESSSRSKRNRRHRIRIAEYFELITAGDVARDLIVDAAGLYDDRVPGVRQQLFAAPVQTDPVVDYCGVAASLPQCHAVANVTANKILLRCI